MKLPTGMQKISLRRARGEDGPVKPTHPAKSPALLHERSDEEDNEASSSDEDGSRNNADSSSVESETSDTSLTAFREQQAALLDQSRGSNDPPR